MHVTDANALPVELRLHALRVAGHDRTRATELVIEEQVASALGAVTAVLVEGVSDQIALEVVAARLGRDLRDEGISIVPMGGITNIHRFMALFGDQARDTRLAGLYDLAEEGHVRRALEQSGFGLDLERRRLEQLGFFVCVTDLEDEFLRRLGPARVEEVIESQGELKSLRTLQKQPFHRGRPHEGHLRLFVRARNYRYARLLAEALDPSSIPGPLARLLAHL